MKTTIAVIAILIVLMILFFPTREEYKNHIVFESINGEYIEVEIEASRKIRYDIIDHVLSFGGGDSKVRLMSVFCSDFNGTYKPLLLDIKDKTGYLVTSNVSYNDFRFFQCLENSTWEKIDKSKFPLELSIPNRNSRRNQAYNLHEFIYGTGIVTITLWEYLTSDTYFKDYSNNEEKFLEAINRYNQEVFPPGKGVIFENEKYDTEQANP